MIAAKYLCNDCGVLNEADDLHRCSLDAYAEAGDYDLFCPCGSDDLTVIKNEREGQKDPSSEEGPTTTEGI